MKTYSVLDILKTLILHYFQPVGWYPTAGHSGVTDHCFYKITNRLSSFNLGRSNSQLTLLTNSGISVEISAEPAFGP